MAQMNALIPLQVKGPDLANSLAGGIEIGNALLDAPIKRKLMEAQAEQQMAEAEAYRSLGMSPYQAAMVQATQTRADTAAVPEDVRLYRAWQSGEFDGGGGGVEPYRLGPDGRNLSEAPAFIQNKFMPLADQERVKAEGKAAGERSAQAQKRQDATNNLAAGIQNLWDMAATGEGAKYDDPSFENAVGPLQGSTPDSLVGAGIVNAARLGGEAMNYFEGGQTVPSKVRSDIHGGTLALAAAIKPLIRGPGEGTWTDKDQELLNSIVGDLAQARTKEEFRARIQDVTTRLNANFGLQIPMPGQPAMDMATEPQASPVSAPNPGQFKLPPGMSLEQLRSWVQEAMAAGKTKEQIRQKMIELGIDPDQ